MPKYHVHCFAVVRVRVPNVRAMSQQQAIELATKSVNWHRVLGDGYNIPPTPGEPVSDQEFAEEFSHFLVDEADDPEYEQSRWYNSHLRPMDIWPKGTKKRRKLARRKL